jgi:hypothetical protein
MDLYGPTREMQQLGVPAIAPLIELLHCELVLIPRFEVCLRHRRIPTDRFEPDIERNLVSTHTQPGNHDVRTFRSEALRASPNISNGTRSRRVSDRPVAS